MSENELHIKRVPVERREEFRAMAEVYWYDLMPDSSVCKSREDSDAFFGETFMWEGGDRHPYWVLLENRPIGFVSFDGDGGDSHLDGKIAYVHDFYVSAKYRRKGYGSEIVKWLFGHLDSLGIERLDI